MPESVRGGTVRSGLIGILIDAFVVRMTLIPALMSLLGERAWRLPRPLNRIVPNVDIEGTNLNVPRAPARLPQRRRAHDQAASR